jgi:hypothetical protein
MNIRPIEDYVFEGLSQRVQQVFNCICLHTSFNDKTKVLSRVFQGKPIEYPYIFMTTTSISHNPESYTTNIMARRGLVTTINDTAQTVRIMPANFEIELEYITNKFQGLEQGSVIAFARRWLFARRCGYLRFNIRYGRLDLWISPALNESVAIPQLDNKVETETAYKTTVTMTVHGYISEPTLGSQGVISEILINGVPMNPDGSVPGAQFFPFN